MKSIHLIRKYAVLVAVLGTGAIALAADPAPARAPAANKKNDGPASTRSKSIKFEDDVVEGMNRNPLDSAESLGRRDNGNHGHLYKKPTDFKDGIKQTVHEMGKTP